MCRFEQWMFTTAFTALLLVCCPLRARTSIDSRYERSITGKNGQHGLQTPFDDATLLRRIQVRKRFKQERLYFKRSVFSYFSIWSWISPKMDYSSETKKLGTWKVCLFMQRSFFTWLFCSWLDTKEIVPQRRSHRFPFTARLYETKTRA